MKLRALSKYRNARESYLPGQVFDTTAAHAEFLKRDAPGCFEDAHEDGAPDTKAPSAPVANKAVLEPVKKK